MPSRNRIEQCKLLEPQITELYKTGLSTYRIAERLGCSQALCFNVLQRLGETRDLSKSHRKYELNEHFFDVIDTYEKAYWLGFIAADGCLMHNTLSITLAKKDAAHLAKFLQAINSAAPTKQFNELKYGQYRDVVRVDIYSKAIYTALKMTGLRERKSLNCETPNLSPSLLNAFYLGAFDGDGWIYQIKSGAFHIGFCGSLIMVNEFNDFIKQNINYSATVRVNTKNQNGPSNWKVCYGHQLNNLKIINLLYKDCNKITCVLDRKYEISQKLILKMGLSNAN